MIRKHLLIALAAVALLLVGATACTEDSGDTKTTGTTEDVGATGDESTDEGEGEDGSTDETDEDSEDTEDEQASSGGDCPTQAEVDEMNTSMDAMADDPTADPDELVAAADEALEQMSSYLPSEYDADVETLREGMGVIFDAYASIDMANPTPEQLAELEAAMAGVDQAELEAAAMRIQEYFAQACPDLVFE